MSPLILASTSRYRRELFARLGLRFSVEDPGVDEERFKSQGLHPHDLARTLALEKAKAVKRHHPDAIIIGSDQLLALEETILGKPGDAEGAFRQLKRLEGRTHELITAVAVLAGTVAHHHTDVTRLHMEPLSDDAIRRYVATDEPFDCAGSYKIECRGIALFQRVESADFTAIQGLPLIALCGILRQLGIAVP